MTTKLCELAEKYIVDKCPKYHHNYTPKYDELLKDKNIKSVLEIGVGYPELMKKYTYDNYKSGASLFMWRDYFDCPVNGADIRDFNINSSNINIYKCDQYKSQSLIDMMNKIGKVDFIIDDGSHILEHQILTFNTISKYCNKIYIIEDVYCKDFDNLSKLTNDNMKCTLTYLPNQDNQGFVVFERIIKPTIIEPKFNLPILYINLDSRKDRREHMDKLLEGYNYERVSAVYDEFGYIGCSKSHIKCMDIIIEKGYDKCVILEDDFMWKNDNNFENLRLPVIDYDIFLFCNNIKKSQVISQYFNRVIDASWTSGYIVNKTIVKSLRDNMNEGVTKLSSKYEEDKKKGLNEPMDKYFDFFLDIYWIKLFDKYRVIGLNKMPAKQLPGYSDIRKRNMNRDN
tara:strand:+ start:257 stop:1450 length:1194 start_codon:yes stop_codon:yes gene_type:complete